MITAIVNRKDSDSVCDALTKGGFLFTKIATSGGFLKKGNVTLLIGTDIDRVNDAVDIIRDNSARRTEAPSFLRMNAEQNKVLVGGATIFVTDVEYFEKI